MSVFPSSPKILYLENGDILGGAELFSLDLLSGETETSPKFFIGIGKKEGAVYKNWEELSRTNENISVHEASLPQLKPFSFVNIWKFITVVFALKKKIKEEHITHVHANTVRSFLIAGGVSFFVKGVFFSFFAHDFTAPPLFLKAFAKRFQKIFACSRAVKEYLISAGVKESSISIVHNGVDPKKFESIPPLTAENLAKKDLNIGIIGRIDTWKGQHIFIQAAKIFVEAYPSAKFFIFGQPSQHDPATLTFFKGLQDFVKDHHLEKNVFFEGFTPPENALLKIDILVHAATEKEPFGRVPIEGAMSGRGLVLSKIGTPTEIFTEGENALFFEPKNAFDLATKIKTLWENRIFLEKIATNAKKLAEEKFLLSTIQKTLMDFFRAPLSAY